MTFSFLVFATEWRSGHGGLSTFNRHLCTALARAGCKVTCIIADGTNEDIEDARNHGVELEVQMKRLGFGVNPSTTSCSSACRINGNSTL